MYAVFPCFLCGKPGVLLGWKDGEWVPIRQWHFKHKQGECFVQFSTDLEREMKRQ